MRNKKRRSMPILCLVILALVLTACAQKSAPKPSAEAAPSSDGQAQNLYQDSSTQTAGFAENKAKKNFGSNVVQENTESYSSNAENRFLEVSDAPLSTFSIDVDTASYSNIRRFLTSDQLPPADAVRIEEMINYFKYAYPQPKGEDPFSITLEAGDCPWNDAHKLALIGLQGKELQTEGLPPSNLVFLLDVSGSMNDADKLPLLKEAFKLLVDQLGENDKISIVVYAGASGLVLDSVSGNHKDRIADAIDALEAGGSTAGGAGIKLAYDIARKNYIKNGNNRVILATDGDFNVGVSSDEALAQLIEQKREEGTFLTVLGFGTGNLKDSKMELLADKGNGNYAYIDNLNEAKKVLVKELGGSLFTIAKDVKIQVEFNPAKVKSYRLIGYENRMLSKEDFNDDKKDAGELGAGHSVTALYEIVPFSTGEKGSVDPLKYQNTAITDSNEWMTAKLRYKAPNSDTSQLLSKVLSNIEEYRYVSGNLAFAAAVAEFGMLLKDSEFKGEASLNQVLSLAEAHKGTDAEGYRREFMQLVKAARRIE